MEQEKPVKIRTKILTSLKSKLLVKKTVLAITVCLILMLFIVGQISLKPYEGNGTNITEVPSPTFSPYKFNDKAVNIKEQLLQDPNARILFEKELPPDKNGTIQRENWMSKLDGSQSVRFTLPDGYQVPLNKITHGWIYYITSNNVNPAGSQIVAFNYVTNKKKYISEAIYDKYLPVLGNTYISPSGQIILYDLTYITQECSQHHQAGCEAFSDLPGHKEGVYSYNIESNKQVYLGVLSDVKWDESDEKITVSHRSITKGTLQQNGIVDVRTGSYSPSQNSLCNNCTIISKDYWLPIDVNGSFEANIAGKIQKIDEGIIHCCQLSPNHHYAIYLKDAEMRVLNSSTLEKKTLFVINSNQDIQCRTWVSNTAVLCNIHDDVHQGYGNHAILLDIINGTRKALVPGEVINF